MIGQTGWVPPAEKFVIRAPTWQLVNTLISGSLMCAFLGVVSVRTIAHGPGRGTVISFALLAVIAGTMLWSVRIRVVADTDELRVRNFVIEQRHHRRTIECFVECSPAVLPLAFGGSVAILLTNGRMIELRVTRSGPMGRRRRDEQLARLGTWLGSGAGPRPTRPRSRWSTVRSHGLPGHTRHDADDQHDQATDDAGRGQHRRQ